MALLYLQSPGFITNSAAKGWSLSMNLCFLLIHKCKCHLQHRGLFMAQIRHRTDARLHICVSGSQRKNLLQQKSNPDYFLSFHCSNISSIEGNVFSK